MEPNYINNHSNNQLKSQFRKETVEISCSNPRLFSIRTLNTSAKSFDLSIAFTPENLDEIFSEETVLYKKSRKQDPVYADVLERTNKYVKLSLDRTSKPIKVKLKNLKNHVLQLPVYIYIDREIGASAGLSRFCRKLMLTNLGPGQLGFGKSSIELGKGDEWSITDYPTCFDLAYGSNKSFYIGFKKK